MAGPRTEAAVEARSEPVRGPTPPVGGRLLEALRPSGDDDSGDESRGAVMAPVRLGLLGGGDAAGRSSIRARGTKTPWLLGQVKYRIPPTAPSCCELGG